MHAWLEFVLFNSSFQTPLLVIGLFEFWVAVSSKSIFTFVLLTLASFCKSISISLPPPVFALIYTNFMPLVGEYEKRENYDSVDGKYSAYWLKRMIEDESYNIPNVIGIWLLNLSYINSLLSLTK